MAEEKKSTVKPAAEKIATEAKKAAEAVTAAAAEAAGNAKEAAKEAKKKTTRRTSTRKTTTRTTRAKKPEIKESVSIQYAGKDITAASLIEKTKEIWKDLGKKEADLKTVNVYVKTEENRAYYVINETEVGSFEI